MFVCKRCGNQNPSYIGMRNGKPYCRKCLSMSGDEVQYVLREDQEGTLDLSYELTQEQKELAKKLIDHYKQNENTFVQAVCGAGKTEIVFPLIEYVLKEGKRVGFAIPRKDVVIELFSRIKNAFPNNKVAAIYGEHTEEKEGDIVILTMHQIYRFHQYFDVLIADEIDAFPFHNNELLQHFFLASKKGPMVLMSATPTHEFDRFIPKNNFLYLEKRFHGFPIPVPKIQVLSDFQKKRFLIKKLKQYEREKKPCLVFVPSKSLAEELYTLLYVFFKKGAYVHSSRVERLALIESLRRGILHYLITTSILERGVTIPNLQVIIYGADHPIYDERVIEQISGRVGRKKVCPDGDVFLLLKEETEAVKKAILSIKKHNECL